MKIATSEGGEKFILWRSSDIGNVTQRVYSLKF